MEVGVVGCSQCRERKNGGRPKLVAAVVENVVDNECCLRAPREGMLSKRICHCERKPHTRRDQCPPALNLKWQADNKQNGKISLESTIKNHNSFYTHFISFCSTGVSRVQSNQVKKFRQFFIFSHLCQQKFKLR